MKPSRFFPFAVLAGLGLLLSGGAAGGDRRAPPPKAPQLPHADYEFTSKFPGYCTAKLVLRNAKKLRPLFLVGKGQEGVLAFRPADMKQLGEIAGEVNLENLAGILEVATSSGEVAVRYDRYSAAAVDLERFVGTDWLKSEPRPALELKIKSIEKWTVHSIRQGLVEYKVKVSAVLKVGEKQLEIKQETVAKIHEGGLSGAAHISARLNFTFKGSELGLTGEDAGELEASLMFAGYTRMVKEAQQILKKEILEPPEEGETNLERKP
jgi:hypothetical protein